MSKRGIDISAHQGNINWEQVKKDGIEAVIIRAGYGKNNIDQKWVPNAETVAAMDGIDPATYWFSYAYTEEMAQLEGYYAALATQKKFGRRCIPVGFDSEYDSVIYAAKKGVQITKSMATKFAIAFLGEVKRMGFRPMLYTNIDYLRNYFDWGQIKAAIPETMLWLACWSHAIPSAYKDAVEVWQYSDKGNVAGISGVVDMDEVYVDLELKDGETAAAPEQVPEQTAEQQKKVTATILNIRREPSDKSEDLGNLPKGTILTVDKTENGWAHFEGWCCAKYLK